MKKDNEWLFEKQAMSKKYVAVMKNRVPIRDVPKKISQVAFTGMEGKNKVIYLKKDSQYTKGLDSHKSRAFRFGLFTKEMMKHAFTNYDYQNDLAKTLEPYEVPVFRLICDIIEDPAVEAAAPTMIGGSLLQSLRYCTKRLYDRSALIETGSTPFHEFMIALQQFGDVGLLKGKFKTPVARTMFYRVATTVLTAISEVDNKKRADLELKVLNMTKPLWEAEAKSSYIDPSSEFSELLEGLAGMIGKSMSTATGSGEEADPEELAESADFTKGAIRKTVFREMGELTEEEKEMYEKMKEEDEETEFFGEKDPKGGMTSMSYADDENTIIYDKDHEGDLSTIEDYDPEMDEIDVDGCDFFDRLVRTEVEISEAEERGTMEGLSEAPEFPEISKKYTSRSYKCKNSVTTLKESSRSAASSGYNRTVMENSLRIETLYKKLKALFAEESEEVVYKSSGKLSLKKSMSSTVSSKMFTKKMDPKDRSNLAVMVAIDESGSMSGTRIERAKAAAICLAEVFKKLDIPLYVMGFTADCKGADVVHNHYAMWSNAADDLLKLTSIHADSNNFDGYSIRYASKVLSKRPETHKMLIVISDGQPAASAYSYELDGYSDTKDSIREARKQEQVVLGIAIGADIETLHKMYGNDFIFINHSEDLFTGIVSKFHDIVKKW